MYWVFPFFLIANEIPFGVINGFLPNALSSPQEYILLYDLKGPSERTYRKNIESQNTLVVLKIYSFYAIKIR